MFFDSAFLFAILIGALIVFGIWCATRTKWPVKIIVDRAGVASHQGLPKARAARVVEFFEREVSCDTRVVVSAMRQPNGYLRTKIAGPIDQGTKQRIRNFLLSML